MKDFHGRIRVRRGHRRTAPTCHLTVRDAIRREPPIGKEGLTLMIISIRSILTSFATGAMLIPALVAGLSTSSTQARAQDMSNGADNFYKSDKVTVQKVSFKNQYQMSIAGNLFIPTGSKRDAKLSAIIVGHPMGAVKEQSANL